MSSWRPTAPAAPIRLGYKQLTPEGNFIEKTLPVTVVSAYYPMKSKYSKDNYTVWIKQFLENMDCHLLFFTDESMVDFVNQHRSKFGEKTNIIILPREEWEANIKFPAGFWEKQWRKDPEKDIHSPELYQIWYEKKEFVRKAIQLNPYGSTDFIWCDAGILRSQEMIPLVKNFPVANRIPTDKILMMNVWPFTRNDEVIYTISGELFMGGASGKPRIGGNLIAASVPMWDKYCAAYDWTFNKYNRAGLFVGKDQNIMTTLVLENRQVISLIDSKQCFSNIWTFGFLWLGAPSRLFEFLQKEKWYGKKLSWEDLKQLI